MKSEVAKARASSRGGRGPTWRSSGIRKLTGLLRNKVPRNDYKVALSVFIIVLTLLFFASVSKAANIKFAIVAPEGSAWANIVKEMGVELSKKTEGRLGITLYAGGVAGDEEVVIKKMKIGQIDAAGFTGYGLGKIYPAIRVLELPFMFNSSKEVDYVVGKLMPEIKSGFSSKGFEFLGWAESGFVYIFSNKPIKGLADMKGVKMWMWQGDPLAQKMYESFEVAPVPLAIPDVMMALQTKMIDGVYAPPLGAIAMQWFAKTRYMSDAKLVNSIGGILITKRAYNKIGPADQVILKDVVVKYSEKLVALTRKDNVKAVETLKEAGVQVVKVKGLDDLVSRSKVVWSDLAGQLYPKELLDKTVAYVEESRK